MSHVPYLPPSVNSQPIHVQNVNNRLNPVQHVNSTTQLAQTVTSQPTQSTPVNTTAPHHAQTVHTDTHYQPRSARQPAPDPTAQQLWDTLQPLLHHRHSTLSTINTLLRPHLHHPSPPTPRTMATLRHLLQDCPTAKHILPPIRPTRNRPNPNYDETGPQHRPLLPRPPVHFPLGQADGVGVGPSTLNAPGIDAGSGLFAIRPKKAQYANKTKYRNIFAKAGDYICAYNGTNLTRQDCITTPSLYLFADPDDPQQRYIDSWDPARGVLSYGGYLNETFEDEDINCTIKFKPHQAHPGSTPNVTSTYMKNSSRDMASPNGSIPSSSSPPTCPLKHSWPFAAGTNSRPTSPQTW